MAVATVTSGNQLQSGQIAIPVGRAAFVKQNWSDAWIYVPYLDPLDCTVTAAPSVPGATFEYKYGYIRREGLTDWATYYPLNIGGWYIATYLYDFYGYATPFIGVVDFEHHSPFGTVGYFQGPQQLNAFGLEHLLDRVTIRGSYTAGGFIDRPLQFNRREGRGINLRGNRSNARAGNGAYTFSADGSVWTSLDIVEYLLANYYPAGLTFYLVGDYAALGSVREEWDFQGGSVFDALNSLIDQKRGLGWRLFTTGTGGIYFYVFSTLAYPIYIGANYVPANGDQTFLSFDGAIDVQPEITVNKLNRYENVVVRGGPIRVTCSFSAADGTLEPAWASASETAYKSVAGATNALKDSERNTEKYGMVYQAFRVPAAWDWLAGDGEGGAQNNAAPGYDLQANIDVAAFPNHWQDGVNFSREIPIEEESADASQPTEYRKAMLIVQDPSDATKWHFVDKVDAIGLTPSSLHVSDRSLTVYVRPQKAPHVGALNHFDDATYDTDIVPEYDYSTYILTAQLTTSAHPTVFASLPGIPLSETGRTKVIERTNCEVWIVLPGTVYDVTDGALVKEAAYTIVRDDTDSLRQIAAFAVAYYCVPRNNISWTLQGLRASNPPGQIVRGYASNWTITDVNTVVTQMRMVFGALPTTTWETGYTELDLEKAMPGTMASPQGRQMKYGSMASRPGDMASVPGSMASVPGSMASRPGSMASRPGSMASRPGSMAARDDGGKEGSSQPTNEGPAKNIKDRNAPNKKDRNDPNLKDRNAPNKKDRNAPEFKDRNAPNFKDRDKPDFKGRPKGPHISDRPGARPQSDLAPQTGTQEGDNGGFKGREVNAPAARQGPGKPERAQKPPSDLAPQEAQAPSEQSQQKQPSASEMVDQDFKSRGLQAPSEQSQPTTQEQLKSNLGQAGFEDRQNVADMVDQDFKNRGMANPNNPPTSAELVAQDFERRGLPNPNDATEDQSGENQ